MFEKDCITVAITVNGAGHLLSPYIVFKNLQNLPLFDKNNMPEGVKYYTN